MTGKDDNTPEPASEKRARKARVLLRRYSRAVRRWLRPLIAAWLKFYGPFDRSSARFLDSIAAVDRRRRIAAIAVALSINVIVLTLVSVFARVRIWIPNAPSDMLQVTLVEMAPFETPELRDPEIAEPEPELEEPEPEPEPEEPEVVEELQPEPEPVQPAPLPETVEETEPEPEPDIEPEIVEEREIKPEPEPDPQPVIEEVEMEPLIDLNLDLEPLLAPPADEPEPLIPDPVEAPQEELILQEPEEEAPEQAPEEEALEPLLSVEPERSEEAGLDEMIGDEETDGEESAADEAPTPEEELPEEEEPEEQEVFAAEEPAANDDMFDQNPGSGRFLTMPRVELPQGDPSALSGSSGVVAIFCPEQFENEDKAAECAGRREIRSGWRPGASGENWARAEELLRGARSRGQTGPDLDKLLGPAAAIELKDTETIQGLRDFRRNVGDAGSISQGSNADRGLEATRPDIGPPVYQPTWTLREDEDLSLEDIEKLKKELEEAEEKK